MSRMEEGKAVSEEMMVIESRPRVYREAAVRLKVHSHNNPVVDYQSARDIPIDIYEASSHKFESRVGKD